MTVLTTTLSDDDLDILNLFHGHLCPMVLLGARTAKKAIQAFPAPAGKSSKFGYYRGYGCAVDGIQVFSGCTWGNSNLVLLRGGNFAFILTAEGSSEGVMVAPQPHLFKHVRENRTPPARAALMDKFTSAPDTDLLEIAEVRDLGVLSDFPGE